ncbi:uncharacterized protein LOC8288715 isoform X3 [Ricinus communis]|uniref:uncharacterized protein LOC8288715 isoform X3 n=1 Tax=Ricinus communis TaxID=3988 RepID=UPI00201B2884|nr:uncharacterized protein LOC8288715 isoform X3 [Ricinus communis]XP_048233430.1 uncharacterized protein LOC8288715 isoform X3 [Ricinus communis]
MEEWQTNDHLVMSMPTNTMESQISRLCMLMESSKAIWEKLKGLYGHQNNFAHIFRLKQELSQITQGTKNPTEYATEILTRWEELQNYLPPSNDPEELQRRAEQDLIYTYLGGLDSSYESLRSQILLISRLPSIDAVIATIQHEETRRNTMNGSSKSTDSHSYLTRRDQGRQRGGPSAIVRCDHCIKQDHHRDGCWHLHPQLRPSRGWEGAGSKGGERRGGGSEMRREENPRKGVGAHSGMGASYAEKYMTPRPEMQPEFLGFSRPDPMIHGLHGLDLSAGPGPFFNQAQQAHSPIKPSRPIQLHRSIKPSRPPRPSPPVRPK